MRQEFRIDQRMQQRIVMTPMLQQALKILQMSTLELKEWIDQEMVENPVLEEDEEALAAKDKLSNSAETDNVEVLAREELEPESDPSVDKALESRSNDMVEQLKKSTDLGEDFWERYDISETSAGAQEAGSGSGSEDTDQEKHDFAEASLTREPSLSESLEWQLSMSPLNEEDRAVARALIGNLDENGYLTQTLEDSATALGTTPAKVEAVLLVIQSFEPVGVAARNLRECLLLQLEARKGPVAERAYEIVKDFFEDLEKRRFPNLTKALHCGKDELQQSLDCIATLDPKPGRNFATERTKYVVPDVSVVSVDGEWIVQLVDEDLPRLRISPYYRKMLKAKAEKGSETKAYLEGKIQSALWLIKNIEQRRKTLAKVSEAIFKIQRDFLDFGVSRLKPLTLKQVADIIGMHESTVSRVTTHKYAQTTRGLYELKYFFTSGLESDEGLDVSSMSVKELIKELVALEPPDKPLSDQHLTEALREKGIQIARRTVAKYREELRIPSASQRRKL